MSKYARRIVSWNKARFKDDKLDIDLDACYLTDRLIIMGYPADGLEALYRNNREDARKFLEGRHGDNYWIFNFCPIYENSYQAGYFHNRVSRYPFPDHHAPPLALVALAVREMDQWLSGSPDRIVAVHCKAGKGRSGTLACAYLLTTDHPTPPRLERSYNSKEWAKLRAEKLQKDIATGGTDEWTLVTSDDKHSVVVPPTPTGGLKGDKLPEDDTPENLLQPPNKETIATEKAASASDTELSLSDNVSTVSTSSVVSTKSTPLPGPKGTSLERILALHTSRRMKVSSDQSKQPRGVSIPSQRRFLYYWSLLVSNAAPPGYWDIFPNPVRGGPSTTPKPKPRPKVRLLDVRVRMRETGPKLAAVNALSKIIETTTKAVVGAEERGEGDIWISLSRYDDALIETLEKWEKHTRHPEKGMGKRREGSEVMKWEEGEDHIDELFSDGRWDRGKMVRSFARLAATKKEDVIIEKDEDGGRIRTHILHAFPSKWVHVKTKKGKNGADHKPANDDPPHDDEESELEHHDETDEGGVLLDAGKEVRAKLYFGQVLLGWFWFIPMFHMPPPPSSKLANKSAAEETVHFRLERADLDFALGAGAWIIDVDVSMEWAEDAEGEPPARQTSAESVQGIGTEPKMAQGLMGDILRIVQGEGVETAVKAGQADAD